MKYKKVKPLTIKGQHSVVRLTKEQAENFGIDVTKELNPAEIETSGPWDIISSYKALAINVVYDKTAVYTKILSRTLFGIRKLSKPQSCNYHLEGDCSIGGKQYSAFTSTMLVEVDNKIIDVAVICVRIPDEEI